MPAIGGTVGKAEASEHNLPRYIPGSLVLSLVPTILTLAFSTLGGVLNLQL